MRIIGVFFGGHSPEHEVSIFTGQLVMAGLKKLGHTVVPIYVGKDGIWYTDENLESLEFFLKKDYIKILSKLKPVRLSLSSHDGRLYLEQNGFWKRKNSIDLIFPAFHGQNGEDGTFQGMCEMLGVPYVGCEVAPSAIAMDKVLTKLLYQQYQIPTTPFLYFQNPEWEGQQEQIIEMIKSKLHWPLFIKPARLGSSIGIAKVHTDQELLFAVEVALHYDQKVLVEEGVEHVMDVTCAVLGNYNPRASLLQETRFTKEFFSYEDKYIEGGGAQLGNAQKKIVIPASLDEQMTKEIQTVAIRIFKLFECTGISRVDFLYNTQSRQFFANEINTLPGTLYHHLWKASGMEFEEVLTELIRCADERYATKRKIIRTFESDILQSALGAKLKL